MVRSCLPMFESETKESHILVFYSGKRNKKFKSKADCQASFTLHKYFIDTQNAINRISKLLNKKPNDFNVAGNKDKRGVTTQRVFCKKLSVDHAMKIRMSKSWPENVDISNFKEGADPIHIGDLYGNQFKVVLRLFNAPRPCPTDIAKSELGLMRGRMPPELGVRKLFRAAALRELQEQQDARDRQTDRGAELRRGLQDDSPAGQRHGRRD